MPRPDNASHRRAAGVTPLLFRPMPMEPRQGTQTIPALADTFTQSPLTYGAPGAPSLDRLAWHCSGIFLEKWGDFSRQLSWPRSDLMLRFLNVIRHKSELDLDRGSRTSLKPTTPAYGSTAVRKRTGVDPERYRTVGFPVDVRCYGHVLRQST